MDLVSKTIGLVIEITEKIQINQSIFITLKDFIQLIELNISNQSHESKKKESFLHLMNEIYTFADKYFQELTKRHSFHWQACYAFENFFIITDFLLDLVCYYHTNFPIQNEERPTKLTVRNFLCIKVLDGLCLFFDDLAKVNIESVSEYRSKIFDQIKAENNDQELVDLCSGIQSHEMDLPNSSKIYFTKILNSIQLVTGMTFNATSTPLLDRENTLLSEAKLNDGKIVSISSVKNPDLFKCVAALKESFILKVLNELNIPGVMAYHGSNINLEYVNIFSEKYRFSLHDLLYKSNNHRYSVLDFLFMLQRVAKTMAILHENGLTHRNLAFKSIFLTKSNIEHNQSVKLSGFKLAAISSREFFPNEYPPTLQDDAQESDIYAFGVLLAEIITGKPQYGEKNLCYEIEYKADIQNELPEYYLDGFLTIVNECRSYGTKPTISFREIDLKLKRLLLSIREQQAQKLEMQNLKGKIKNNILSISNEYL